MSVSLDASPPDENSPQHIQQPLRRQRRPLGGEDEEVFAVDDDDGMADEPSGRLAEQMAEQLLLG